MADKGGKVSISVKQRAPIEDAPGCDQGVDRLPNGYASGAQNSEVLGGGDSDLKPPDLNEFQASQQAQRLKVPALMKSRQELCQDDIAYGHHFRLEQLIEARDLGVVGASKRNQPRRSFRQASQFTPHRLQVSGPG